MSVTPILLEIQMIAIPTLVWALYVGIVIGILSMYYNKSYLGSAIRSILEHKAIDAENAMTAEALGFHKKPLILHAIENGILSKYVKPIEKDGVMHYYVTEEDRIRVELRYSAKGTDLYVVIVSLILFFIVALVASRYLPDIIAAAGDLAS
ncbi:MAG: hypothetical protein IJW46_01715 [Clostridia bacterium]|nr:hypothetical protein [Clostridia bacterium]